MMKSWMMPSFFSLLFYGLWGFLGARASQLMNAKVVFLFSCCGAMLVGLLVLPFITSRMDVTFEGASLSLLNGLATGLGTLMFIYALQKGPAIPIVMITALYPVVTIFLTVLFLNQSITIKQGLGVIFSMMAIYCLTIA